MPAGTVCGFMSAGGCLTLLCSNLLASPRLPEGVLFSESGAFAKRLGGALQGCPQSCGGLSCMTCGALGSARLLGSLTLARGLPPEISCLLARSSLLEPTEARPLLLEGLRLSGLLTVVGQALAPIRDFFTVVGGPLALIGDPLTLIGDPLPLIRCPLPLIRAPLALIGDPRSHRRPHLLTALPTLAGQPGTLALQELIMGLELRRAAADVRAEALDLDPRHLIVLL